MIPLLIKLTQCVLHSCGIKQLHFTADPRLAHDRAIFDSIGLEWARFNVPLDTFEVISETVGWLRHQPGL